MPGMGEAIPKDETYNKMEKPRGKLKLGLLGGMGILRAPLFLRYRKEYPY